MFSKTISVAFVSLLIATFVSGESAGRIVGGFSISIKIAPYQVSLQYVEQSTGLTRHFCGGSIISEKFIVTAGHCTENLKRQDVIVLVGTSFNDRDGKKIQVERIINHPLYNTRNQDYDVALLELSENLVYSDSIQPIALPDDNEIVRFGTMCLISGWGDQKLKQTSPQKSELRAVEVPVVNFRRCNYSYRMFGGITPRMMCAGFENGGKDACQGDSGGPLACQSNIRIGNRTTTLFGVTSWGFECAVANYPGVYADVRVLAKWIREQTGL